MADRAASRTALGVALLRAAHQRLDAPPLILDDPIAERLLDPDARAALDGRAADFRTPGATGLRSHVVLRSRFAEDELREAVRRGARQYVVLGAGYDTFAYRQPPWAKGLTVFEVDQPATQADKRGRLQAAGISVPPDARLVSVDFEHEDLTEQLAAVGFDPLAPSFFSWLGVTTYLDKAANDAVFAYVASLPASTIVFTFATAGAETSQASARIEQMAADAGEPWRTRYEPQALVAKLGELGFASIWMPTPAELTTRYFANRPDDLPAPRRRTLVRAARNT